MRSSFCFPVVRYLLVQIQLVIQDPYRSKTEDYDHGQRVENTEPCCNVEGLDQLACLLYAERMVHRFIPQLTVGEKRPENPVETLYQNRFDPSEHEEGQDSDGDAPFVQLPQMSDGTGQEQLGNLFDDGENHEENDQHDEEYDSKHGLAIP